MRDKHFKIIKNFLYVLFIFSSFTYCKEAKLENDTVSNSGKIYHPTEQNIPNSTIKIANNSTSEVLYKEDNFLRKLGQKTGSDEQIFGEIKDLVRLSDGNLIVLDSRFIELRIYNSDFELIRRKKLSGRGPGEFLDPAKITNVGSDIYILDRYNKVNKYNYSNGDIDYEKSILLKFVPEDMCAINEVLYIRGINIKKDGEGSANKIIHSYSLKNGESLNSIIEPYKSPNNLVTNQLSDGPILCNDKLNIIYFAHEYLPYVYAYDIDKKENYWIAELEDFKSLEITEYTENNRPTVAQRVIYNYSEQIESLIEFNQDSFLVQTKKFYPKTRSFGSGLYMINKTTGNGLKLDSRNEKIIFVDDVLITTPVDKYPQLKIYKNGF